MLSFSDFVKQSQETLPVSILSWDGSFASIRNKIKFQPNDISWLNWASSFAKRRDKNIKEAIDPNDKSNALEHNFENSPGKHYDTVHDHPNLVPQNLTDEHREVIGHYSETPSEAPEGKASSKNINAWLRNKLEPDGSKHQTLHHSPQAVEGQAKLLASAFTPENTNKQSAVVYIGVPPHVGHQLMKAGPGSIHHTAGFASASTDPDIAHEFGVQYAVEHNSSRAHVLVCHAHAGTGISVPRYSGVPGENEIILMHGLPFKYHGSEKDEDAEGNPIYYHYVTVKPEGRIPLNQYGPYKPAQ